MKQDNLKTVREALEAANQFIQNGCELGFIQMPLADDPALQTPAKIEEALTALAAHEAAVGWSDDMAAVPLNTPILVKGGKWVGEVMTEREYSIALVTTHNRDYYPLDNTDTYCAWIRNPTHWCLAQPSEDGGVG